MIRLRRYRLFAVFAVFLVGAVYYFATYNKWDAVRTDLLEGFKNPSGLLSKVSPSSDDVGVSESFGVSQGFGSISDQPTDPGQNGEQDATSTSATTTTTTSTSALSYLDIPTEKPEPDKGDFGEFGLHGQGRHEVPPNLPDTPAIHWSRMSEHFPVPSSLIIPLPTEKPVAIPKIQYAFKEESAETKKHRLFKRDAIKDAFKHSWSGYRTHAWLEDELSPVSGGSRNPFCQWAATLVDSLDTLWIMGLESEFKEAVEAVKQIDFTTSPRKDIPVFETTIRYLGGLISAYDISGQKYKTLLDKAVELADILYGAFDTPNRMPITYYYWRPAFSENPHRAGTRAVMAEIGSLSMEFTRLAQLTKDDRYYDAIARITNEFQDYQDQTRIPGLWPHMVDVSGCKKPDRTRAVEFESSDEQTPFQAASSNTNTSATASNSTENNDSDVKTHQKRQIDTDAIGSSSLAESEPQQLIEQNPTPQKVDCEAQGMSSPPSAYYETFSLGGEADSTFEYLPKQFMLLGGTVPQYKDMFEKVIAASEKHLLYRPMVPDERDILAAGTAETQLQSNGDVNIILKHDYSHLTCFIGGMWGIGGKIFDRPEDVKTAAKLADACVWAYESTMTGIMPESLTLMACESRDSCPWNQTMWYERLDPGRKAREEMQERLRQSGEIAKDSATSTASPSTSVSEAAESPATPATDSVAKRQVGAVENDIRLPKLKTSNDGDEVASKTSMFPTETVKENKFLTHEEFVEDRIKNEHIPLGMPIVQGKKYILRPEAIESVFIMYRITGDETWREKGWAMFKSIRKHCLSQYGYSAIGDVTSPEPYQLDSMESFWLAETLKYFYLLFSTPDVVSLDEYVLNTEAHPFKRPK